MNRRGFLGMLGAVVAGSQTAPEHVPGFTAGGVVTHAPLLTVNEARDLQGLPPMPEVIIHVIRPTAIIDKDAIVRAIDEALMKRMRHCGSRF